MLLGKAGCPLVLPAANVLAQNVNVRPKWQFEGLLMLAQSVQGYTINLGYNAWITGEEHVSRKDKWDNCSYGFVGKEFADDIFNFEHYNDDIRHRSNFSLAQTNLTNTIGRLDCAGSTAAERGFITEDQLLTNVAETPAIFTNTLFISIGKHWDQKEYTSLFGGGFSYEWSSNNAALEQFCLWLKAGILFW